MSGHSKWSTIKRKKGKADAQRGKLFGKINRLISVAARNGGDPDANVELRNAIQLAKENNMPNENIERAIKKGTGEIEGVSYEEVTYEGYGPGGVAVLIEVLTDNRNRTVSEVRRIFTKHGGNLGSSGCVAWMFTKKALFVFDKGNIDQDTLLDVALEVEVDDIETDDKNIEITLSPTDFEKFKQIIDDNKIKYSVAEITMIPQTTVNLEGKKAEQMLSMMEQLEDNDDVQNVYANFNIDEQIMEELSSQ
ncbi:MAG: YebC/PmpR family DNA-binding transcriptional regulator [Candidatus Caldatribacteriota bacterium]|jgi:YebC/PmpR family DNA-binding regulatory protein|nr:YebC/PmpR family DNA-binding transcriptional regulator [Atribacterota bacterium]MDD3641655.1 YebC/PmpR family DNA-binding transcriptional regulator [Atribacterota bacterium]MDD4288619.1 YebC/PmpR family DNA-binding transcriptional regulator [Atribacterota bacterium]MDD4765739.1 YebC/PmpR family DNA-binding transcriptional regulator [Atribacterota bacterium]MDI9596649.1 YebC/PmpR family DNA-binding transcriptional regulator [Atribacterota bacterium]